MNEVKEAVPPPLGGVGMPAALWLHEFGSQVWGAFGDCPYHVGSSLRLKTGWRDVDVRLILSDEDFESLFPGLVPGQDEHWNGKWVALCLAFSALGKQMTGLPIDFQIQQRTKANLLFGKPGDYRSALGVVPLRFK